MLKYMLMAVLEGYIWGSLFKILFAVVIELNAISRCIGLWHTESL